MGDLGDYWNDHRDYVRKVRARQDSGQVLLSLRCECGHTAKAYGFAGKPQRCFKCKRATMRPVEDGAAKSGGA